MTLPDWNEVEEKLYAESVAAIEAFAAQHPVEEVCYFAYDTDPQYGYILICFDTSENSVSEAKRSAERSIKLVEECFRHGWDWQMAKATMISAAELPFTNNSADFKYHGFWEVEFEGWEELAESEDYPVGDFEGADDYLEGNVALIFWKVFDRLIREGLFSGLRMASPFYVGYGFHDEDQVILRILNW